MSGAGQLLAAIASAASRGEELVLATVVRVEGSAYRRPGARMLVLPYGEAVGSISGGCLEAEVCKKAWWITAPGPVVRCYSTGGGADDDDDDTAREFGLGCNGKVHVLLERLPAAGSPLVELLRAVRGQGRPAVVATVVTAPADSGVRVGERLLLDTAGTITGQLANASLDAAVRADLPLTLAEAESSLTTYSDRQGDTTLFLEYLAPPPRLLVFGAGHDAEPLVQMAVLQGLAVTVVDSRTHYARPERFAGARAVLATLPEPELATLAAGAAAVVMTHNLRQDRRWLAALLRQQPAYIGQLGPRDRTEQLLAAIGTAEPLPGLGVLHAPLGLDLGGDTPEVVALGILAEVMAALQGGSGQRLHGHGGHIHRPLRTQHRRLTVAALAEQS